MSITTAAFCGIITALAISLAFLFITRHFNKKNWEWEESGVYLKDMHRVSLYISIVLFVIFSVFFTAIGAQL